MSSCEFAAVQMRERVIARTSKELKILLKKRKNRSDDENLAKSNCQKLLKQLHDDNANDPRAVSILMVTNNGEDLIGNQSSNIDSQECRDMLYDMYNM